MRSLMIVGKDEQGWSDTGAPALALSAPVKDTVSGTDIGTDLVSPHPSSARRG